ncbi:MAG: HAMP domain-containing histidine kinase [Acaryochloridaceae cyanobacterium CSU_3_4]|nr:HAMP domain-containing histidine kinase [Acaryochloridaceae cyanobacterium CSU_3_4]
MQDKQHLQSTREDCILIVDDTGEAPHPFQSALELAGYWVYCSVSNADALHHIQTFAPHLVLLNLQRSELESYVLMRQLRRHSNLPFIPILLMIDHNPADMVAGLDAGADDFIYRPAEEAELLARVRSLLRLKHSIDDREAIVSMREEFVYRLTHDLKTPLVASDRMFGLLKRGKYGDLPDTAAQVLDSMQNSNKDLLEMTKMLLDIYRYESGQKSLSCNRFNLLKLAASVVEELLPLAEEKGITLMVQQANQTSSKMKEEQTDYGIVGARIELRRAIVNLVGNAIKFTHEGSITLGLKKLPNALEMTVQDTGCGIDPQDQPVIFERAYQGSHRYSGNGLGLNLTRQIVEAHRGTIAFAHNLVRAARLPFGYPSPRPND